MKTTIDAMKRALEALTNALSDDRPYINICELALVDVSKAIAREEAQTVELLVCDKCGIDTPDPWHSSENGSKHYHRCDVCHAQAVEAPLFEAGELGLLNELLNCEHPALFTHQTPATGPVKPPENCGTGHCSCVECVKPAKPPAGEREWVISQLRDNGSRLSEVAADMLADDAQLDTESILIDGIAYTIPSPVAYELLDLHLKLKASEQAQPDNPNKEVDLLHKLGNRLAELLDEDQFSECEDMLLALEAGPWTLKRAQQVEVPQGPTHYADINGELYTAMRVESLGLDKERLMALYKHAAPQPPQKDSK